MTGFDYDKEYKEWKWNVPEQFNMGVDCVDKHVAAGKGDKLALIWENEAGDVKKYTFAQMKEESDKFGNVLRSLGLKKGDRFLIRLPNIPEFQMAFLGGLKIGAVPIPSSCMFKPTEVEYRIVDSEAKMAISVPDYVSAIDEIKSNCPTLEHIIVVGESGKEHISFEELMSQASPDLTPEPTSSEDMAFFCYTSGTTGNPKGAVHLQRWAIGNDPDAYYWNNYQDGDILGHTGDLNWIFPLGNGFLYAWRHGMTSFIYDGRFSPEKWFELIQKHKITNLASVPTCYRMFLQLEGFENKWDLSSLRHCISAGEPLNPEVVTDWKRLLGIDILDGIGMTECMVYLSNIRDMSIKPGSCGKPQPGHVCAIVDEFGKPLGPREEGTLAVRQDDPGLMKEYWNKPDKTAEAFKNGWFLTGDTLYIDEDGYYWFAGRGDDLIMTAGYRVSPFDVESAVNKHPAVLESAAVASPDHIRGVIVKSFIVLNPEHEPSDELAASIKDHCKKTIAAYEYPRAIEFVDSLPKTQSGKTKRKVLREQELAKSKT
ncbi:MAG: acyl-CoA synthetase [Thermoplasmata archaeon]|nr:acyl-CoA synthetase [Thermoplasmata archaeon]